MKKLTRRLSFIVIPYIAWAYLWILGIFSKVKVVGKENREFIFNEENSPIIFAFWHAKQLFFPWYARGMNIEVLISKSRDGELISRVLGLFSLKAIRGSSSKGGAGALRHLLEAIQNKSHVAITPDGPRGPREKSQMGVVQLAKKTGRPIVAVSFDSKYKKIMNSWDRFLVPLPLPFNQINISFSSPTSFSVDDSDEDCLKKIEDLLNQVDKQARFETKE